MHEAVALVGAQSDMVAAVTVRRWSAHLRMLDRDVEEAIKQGEMAMRVAEQQGDQEAIVHCLNTIGSSMIIKGCVEQGRAHLEQSRALAEQLRWDPWVANAYVNLGSACAEVYRFDLADNDLRRGVDFCSERDIDLARLYQLAWQALVWMYRGRWTEVSGVAHVVLADARSPVTARITALIALGRLRARRGDPGVWEALDEAKDLAAGMQTLQRVASMQAARAEAAWFEGRTEDAAKEASVGLELALRKRHPWFAAELLYWCWQGTEAVREAARAGAVVVFAAGNSSVPLADSYGGDALIVAATGPDGSLALYSQRGSGVSVAAPGGEPPALGACNPEQCVTSLFPQGRYAVAAGTSMAAPHVAGIAALLLAQDPTRSGRQVVDRIRGTARPVPGGGAGDGLVDATAALSGAVASRPPSPRPSRTASARPSSPAAAPASEVPGSPAAQPAPTAAGVEQPVLQEPEPLPGSEPPPAVAADPADPGVTAAAPEPRSSLPPGPPALAVALLLAAGLSTTLAGLRR
jgi:hypothetical protein